MTKNGSTRGALALIAAVTLSAMGCGPEDADIPADGNDLEESTHAVTATAVAPFTQTLGIPFNCSSTLSATTTVNTAGVKVNRATCSITCRDRLAKLGIWNLSISNGTGGYAASLQEPLFASQTKGGQRFTASVEAPYAPGIFQVVCTPYRVDSKNYFQSSSFPYNALRF